MHKIYLVTNQVDRKIYIGQTSKTLEWRWKRHLDNHKKLNLFFYYAIRKYGPDNFTIKELEQAETKEQANQRERFYICLTQSYNPKYGYNGTFGGDGGEQTLEIKKKISTNLKIALADPTILAHRREISTGSNNPMFGKHHSDETKQKISIANTGRAMPLDQVEKIRIASTGRKHSEETKLKMSEGAKARNQVANFTKNKTVPI